MGMRGVLCTLSEKRRALLDEDPELISDLVLQRHEGAVPGLLDLDKTWDALSRLLQDTDAADAIALASGRAIGPALAYGPARTVPPEVVAKLAAALPDDPEAFVQQRFARLGGGEGVHGRFGSDEGDVALLVRGLAQVRDLYRAAARDGHGMLAVVV